MVGRCGKYWEVASEKMEIWLWWPFLMPKMVWTLKNRCFDA
jgi:hypothetical protein